MPKLNTVPQQSNLWQIRYPLLEDAELETYSKFDFSKIAKQDFKYLVLATTRPETLLGDTAVAVNPNDERYKHIFNWQEAITPLKTRSFLLLLMIMLILNLVRVLLR